MIEIEINSSHCEFLKAWLLDRLDICDKLLDYFNKNSNKHIPGRVRNQLVKEAKDSTDLVIPPNDNSIEWQEYSVYLKLAVDEYKKLFPYSTKVANWGLVENIQIQHYAPGGGYKAWHTERISGAQPYSSRHLVFMTYLNDVNDQGETEFLHQKIKVKPQKGLTLIWPADWTYYHRGIVSPSEHKYIITGWLSFNYVPVM